MSGHDIRSAARPDPDQPMVDIANYVADYVIDSSEAYETAGNMLLDSLATSMLAAYIDFGTDLATDPVLTGPAIVDASNVDTVLAGVEKGAR